MTIKHFTEPSKQIVNMGRHRWSVARLFELSRDLEVMDVPLRHLNMYSLYEKITLREMAGHVFAVNNADLKYPIILDEDGDLMDGRHRLMKAIINNEETIKVVRFDTNPEPCEVIDNDKDA